MKRKVKVRLVMNGKFGLIGGGGRTTLEAKEEGRGGLSDATSPPRAQGMTWKSNIKRMQSSSDANT